MIYVLNSEIYWPWKISSYITHSNAEIFQSLNFIYKPWARKIFWNEFSCSTRKYKLKIVYHRRSRGEKESLDWRFRGKTWRNRVHEKRISREKIALTHKNSFRLFFVLITFDFQSFPLGWVIRRKFLFDRPEKRTIMIIEWMLSFRKCNDDDHLQE
jgi:hypothetical protein